MDQHDERPLRPPEGALSDSISVKAPVPESGPCLRAGSASYFALLVTAASGVILGWSLAKVRQPKEIPGAPAVSERGGFSRPAVAALEPTAPNAAVREPMRVIHEDEFIDAVGGLGKMWGGELAIRLHELARALAPEEIPAVLEKVRQAAAENKNSSPNPREIIAALASRWAEVAPRAAMAYGWALRDDDARKTFLRVAMAKWTEKDFLAANGWLLAQPSGPARDELYPVVISSIEKSDPRGALALARNMSEGPAQGMAQGNHRRVGSTPIHRPPLPRRPNGT